MLLVISTWDVLSSRQGLLEQLQSLSEDLLRERSASPSISVPFLLIQAA